MTTTPNPAPPSRPDVPSLAFVHDVHCPQMNCPCTCERPTAPESAPRPDVSLGELDEETLLDAAHILLSCGGPGWGRVRKEAAWQIGQRMIAAAEAAALRAQSPTEGGCNGLDTPERVRFYERDFYPLSNFSAFRLLWRGLSFDTSEAAYHFTKFDGTPNDHVCREIREADSAHEAFKVAERNKHLRREDWDEIKLGVMRAILHAKVEQHEYVRRKLLATGDRLLVEDSWRDDYWGWGPNQDGQNWLGKLWMEVRAELRATPTAIALRESQAEGKA